MALTQTGNYIEDIDIMLCQYVDAIKRRTSCNLNSESVQAEGFFRNFLNLLFDLNLSKDTIESPINDTIDLHDMSKKICVQVTANNTKSKVETTVSGFVNKKKYNNYNQLHFLIIDRKRDFEYNENKLIEYSVKIKFHDCTTILKELINNFDSATKIKPVWDFVNSELSRERAHKEGVTIKLPKDNDSSELQKELHLVDIIFESLKVFEGFEFIHPRTVARLPIFNNKENYYDSYSRYCLKTSNKSIHELLQKIKIENRVFVIKDESLKPFEEKLKQIFLILNNCLIYCICYREKYTEIEHHKIKVKHYENNCNCISCQFYNFRIKSLFVELKGKAISHSEKLAKALAEGYYLCKIGEHIKGWQVLNSIAEKSEKQNNYVVHFLSLYNIKQIRNFIDSPWLESESKEIIPKIDEINLYNTINNFSIPVQLRDELLKVKEKYYLHWSREVIDKQFEKILDTKRLYESGGNSWGSNAIDLLLDELHLLFAYYNANHIVIDDFYTFRQAITKGIEGILISFTTDISYEYRYKEFGSLILSFMYFFLEEKKLESLLKEYKIGIIPIDKSEKQRFIITVTNFFTFQYTTGILDSIDFNNDILKQDYFSSYRQSLRSYFNKIMLLLSKTEFTTEELKQLAEPFVNYLRIAEDFNHINWTFALKFFDAKIQMFSTEQIKKIIEFSLDEKHHNLGDDALEKICDLSFKRANFVLTERDKPFFEKLLNYVTTPCKKCDRTHSAQQIFASWRIAYETGKNAIKQKAIEYLQNKFDSDFYMNAVFKGVFNKDEYPELLNNFIECVAESCSPYDIKQENGKWIFQSFTGFNYINCLSYLNVDFKQENVQKISRKSHYYNWLINYENYDYTNFDLKWLTELFVPYHIKQSLQQVEPLKEKVKQAIEDNYNVKLAEFYVKNLIK